MPTSNDAPPSSLPDFSIYVTHGGFLTIKSMAKRFSPGKINIQASFKDDAYTILNKSELLTMMFCDDPLPDIFTPHEFELLIHRIKEEFFLSRPLTMLCVDEFRSSC